MIGAAVRKRMVHTITIVATFLLSALFLSKAFSAEYRYQSACFELHEDGSFFQNTIKQTFGSREGRAILAGVCTYFAGPAAAEQCAAAAELAGQAYARLENREGNEYKGVITTSDGYEICRAYFVTNDFSATSNTDSSMTLRENSNGPRAELGWYAAIGGSPKQGRWVRYQVVLEEIPRGSEADHDCHPEGLLWTTNDDSYTDIPQTSTRLVLPDRRLLWCTGR
ncbi:MAG: hypothetical protein EOS57_08190 [Mesorhizobium sp.]|nr:MAG: hypothetical protein EOS57_08190 [Mesorhizobium sp.]